MVKIDIPFIVTRIGYASDSVLSIATLNNEFLAYLVEDELRDEKVHGETAIEPGIKELKFTESPKFTPIYHHLMIEIITARHKRAYFHPGTSEADTEGCPLVGAEWVKDDKGQFRIKPGYSRNHYLNVFYPKVAEYMNSQFGIGKKPFVLFTSGPADLPAIQ